MTKQAPAQVEASETERTMMDEAAFPLQVPEKGRDLSQLSRGRGQGRESAAGFAKVSADFWQADVGTGVSQGSAGLLSSFILQALGPLSLFLSPNSPRKYPSNHLAQAGHLMHRQRALIQDTHKGVGDHGCS